ncbi:MAG: DEAD/DEAH box helicase [Candidatus Obscuribacter sp.]|nr:DEAD/DEAH box helicase [Candidatus Obscuribacter sp.]
MKTFQELGLSELTIATLTSLGFENPTEVQKATIPSAMEGEDLIVSAQTGSGKTAAYALPIIESLKEVEAPKKTLDQDALAAEGKPLRRLPRWQKMKLFKFEPIFTKALVMVPTRELALQVKEQFIRMNANKALHVVALYGGADYMKQANALKRGAHVIIATPGRLIDFLERGAADLMQARQVVLDEADRLLDLGFSLQINEILKYLPEERQTLVFSATIDKRVAAVANAYQKNPKTVQINTGRIEPSTIDQRIHYLKEKEKEAKLLELVTGVEGSILVFTQTKVKATLVADRLKEANIAADEIHGDIRQKQRERTLDKFRSGAFQVLIATDVAARGLDIPAISHVINYDLPLSSADYVHRIGRTGRAGRSGTAHSFVSEGERYLLSQIEKVVGRQLGDGKGGRDPQERNGGNRRGKSQGQGRWVSHRGPVNRDRFESSEARPRTEQRPRSGNSQGKGFFERMAETRPEYRSDRRPERNYSDSRSEGRPERNYSDSRSEGRPERNYSEFRGEERTSYRSEGRPERNYSDARGEGRPSGGGYGRARSEGGYDRPEGQGGYQGKKKSFSQGSKFHGQKKTSASGGNKFKAFASASGGQKKRFR